MNTLSDSFCVISIVGAVAAAATALFVDGEGADGVVVGGGAVVVADAFDAAAAAAAADTDGHAVVTYHRASSFRIRIVFVSIDVLFFAMVLVLFWFNFGQWCSIAYALTIYQHFAVRFSIELIMATEHFQC